MKTCIFTVSSFKLAGFLARCALLLCLLSAYNTVAYATKFEVDGLYYQTTGANTVKVIERNYSNFTGEVAIPETVVYNKINYAVTGIGDHAFSSNKTITSIIVPNTVNFIEASAFSYSNIASVTLPETIETIGNEVFMSCHRLESIAIPNSVTELRYGAFQGCDHLKSVSLPNSLTTLESRMFDGCVSLEGVNLPTQDNSTKRICKMHQFVIYLASFVNR